MELLVIYALYTDLRALRAYLARRLRNKSDIEDVLQDVMVRLLRVRDEQEEAIESPGAYIHGVASHVLCDHAIDDAYREKNEGHSRDEDENEGNTEDRTEDDIEKRAILQQEINYLFSQLPPKHAEVLWLHKAEGYSYDEVATKLNLSRHTVEKYVTQAKQKLRKVRETS